MGFRIGRTGEALEALGTIGLASLGFAVCTLAGTLALLALIFAARRADGGAGGAAHGGGRATPRGLLRDPVTLLALLAAGVLAGRFLPILPSANGQGLITGVLYALLLVVGVGLAGAGLRFGELAKHPDLFLIPLGTAAGSLLGGLAAGALFGIRPGTSLALSAGFGWYSLSGVILTRLDGPAAGSIAFLSNMLREALAFVLIPLLARTRFPYLAIGSGGATSMDVTLPLIEKSCGPRSVAFAMASGGLLSLSVPILVPLLHQIGG
jgi:uncharacterized membrane protein YbjE (DUF340 family)